MVLCIHLPGKAFCGSWAIYKVYRTVLCLLAGAVFPDNQEWSTQRASPRLWGALDAPQSMPRHIHWTAMR
jgi:hypothetical protein